jgi:hypothetical protein
VILLILIPVIFIPLRSYMLKKTLSAVSNKLKVHHYQVKWDGVSFRGLKSLVFKEVIIRSEDNNNEIHIDSLSLGVRIIPLIFKNIRINKFACREISVRYQTNNPDHTAGNQVQHDSSGIFSQLAGVDLADQTNRFIRRFFKYVPSIAVIRLLDINITYNEKSTRISIDNFAMLQGEVTGMLILSGDGATTHIPVKGQFDKGSHIAEVILISTDTGMFPVPLLRDKYGIKAGFDSLYFAVDLSDHSRQLVNVSGKFNISGLEVVGERLSASRIKINRFRSSFLTHLGKDQAELDSTTKVYLNEIRLRPFFRLGITAKPAIDFELLPVDWNAGIFFASLPAGMFTSLIGLKAEGTLHHFLRFSVDINNPDSLIFATRLTSDNFRILEYGNDDYRLINGSFNHHVYEQGQLKTTFVVGHENPDFIDFDQISPFLRAAVMTSEDGSFFFHNGFNPEAFRESIVTNIRENRFARGGSTLSMQLVKNVFLTRNKTIARKIEEALIVWLIENQNLVSKQRMYEVYLNLIEWGPGIYGINQASWFYFNKKPCDLSLQESIFLASIVPNPRWYKYTFIENGVPKPFFENYFDRMEELMVRKQFITAEDTNKTDPFVILRGRAAEAFAAVDTIRADSLIMKELEKIPAVVKLNIVK